MNDELKTGAVNPQGQIIGAGGQVLGQANPLDVPTSINSSALEATTPYSLPSTPISTEAAGLSTFASTYAKRAKAQQDALAQKTSEAEIAKSEEKKGLFGSIGEYLGILESRPALEKEAGLDVKQQKVTDYTNQIEGLDRAEENEVRAIQARGDITQEAQQGLISNIRAKYAPQKADLAILQAAANRDYETAFNILDRKVQLKLEPLKLKLEFQKMFYDENKALFDKAEQREFDSLVKESERQYNEEKATQEGIASLISTALQNGVQIPQRVLSELNKARSTAEATSILARNGISLQSTTNKLQEEKLRLEIEKARIELKDTVETGKVASGEYGTVINSASNLLGAEKAKQSRKDIASAIADGDYVTAYANIANNVEQALTGEVKTRFANQRNDYSAMLGLRTAIQEYADGGGDMGLLKGTEESIKRKLGIDSGNASVLAVQLWREFQTYRNIMTGAAFTAQESADYASVNPTLKKSLNLNLSVVDGAMNQLENRILSTVETRVPGSKNLYTKISPEASMTDDEAYQLYLETIQTP